MVTAMLPGSSRWMSNEYWCTFGSPLFWSTKRTVPPVLVSNPRLLPIGWIRPPGNGFSNDVIGTAVEAVGLSSASYRA